MTIEKLPIREIKQRLKDLNMMDVMNIILKDDGKADNMVWSEVRYDGVNVVIKTSFNSLNTCFTKQISKEEFLKTKKKDLFTVLSSR